jgi:hypothetical protein
MWCSADIKVISVKTEVCEGEGLVVVVVNDLVSINQL